MNNASSTKQNVNASTGIVVLATNDTKDFYWHSTETLGGGTPPTANFSGAPTSGSSPLTVAFTDTSTGGPTSWAWDFGDPGSGAANGSTLQNPSHTYNADGTYTVKLTATNANGFTTKTLTNYVTVLTAPTANFSGAPTSGAGPLTVSFTDSSTGAPTSWSWNFGDPGSGSANTSALQNPSHTYNADGMYTVSLTASNAAGPNTKTLIGYITVATGPTANFSGTPTTGPSPLDVSFTDASTGNPTSWSWDFGDPGSGSDNASTLQNPSHTYHVDGTYTVTLTASNTNGFTTKTRTNYIVVGTSPVADFSGTPTTGTSALPVTFTDASTGTPTSWTWDFGDPGSGTDNTSSLQNPSHTYGADGIYTVKLTVSNATGTDSKTRTGYITVGTSPSASFTAIPTSGAAPLLVAFTDTTTNHPTSWSWNFGDPGSGGANTSTLQNPSHTYNGGGTYTVTLTATNALGSDTATQTGLITVTSSDVTLTLNPIADSYVSSSNLTGNYGTQTTMKVREGDGSTTNPNYRTYLKFDVSGVSGTVSAVTLRLFVTDPSANIESVFVVGDSSWTETAITYTNAPAISGSAVGTTKSAPAGAYVSITLTPTSVTPGNSPLTLALKSSGTDSLIVSTREDSANKPQLIVTFH
jgi:PKD repeat protein